MLLAIPLTASGHGRAQQDEIAAQRLVTDVVVWAAIVALGAFQVYFHLRSPDFPFEDVAYFEQAKSLLHDGFYGINSVPERVQPPGLAVLLAVICKAAGCGYGVLLGSMAVFLTVGFLVWYQIIRRAESRGVAAATCLLLSSSIAMFSLVTHQICPSIPYFYTSALALWAALKLDAAQARSQKYLLSVVLALSVALSILIQTAAIALVGALAASLAFSFLNEPRVARYRVKVFLPAILLGILTQLVWMHRGSNPPEWPLPGYPGSYLSELKLKLGNYPELGLANTGDLLLRVKANVQERTSTLAQMLTGHWINHSYSSLPMSILLVLTVLGVAGSLWKGENILAWYFLGYEFIYVMWPWRLEFRFLLPSTPLACLFIYRGARNIAVWSRQYLRQIAIGSLVVSLPLGVLAFLNGWGEGPSLWSGLQWRVSAAAWFSLAVLAAWVIRNDRLPMWLVRLSDHAIFRKRLSVGSLWFNFPQLCAAALVVLLVVKAVSQDIPLARRNLAFGEAGLEGSADIVAARWIRSHTDPNVVIAARHVPLVYYYAQRKVIWFAPVVRPQVMLEGLRRLGVRYVLVIDRDDSYYLPPDEVCFDIVERAYPNTFRLAVQLGQARIYEISAAPAEGKS